jgi:hypothetical protein
MSDLPDFPRDDLKAAAGNSPESHAAIDALHAELQGASPDPARISGHVEQLRGNAALLGPLERWWLDPRVQGFIGDINAAGL